MSKLSIATFLGVAFIVLLCCAGLFGSARAGFMIRSIPNPIPDPISSIPKWTFDHKTDILYMNDMYTMLLVNTHTGEISNITMPVFMHYMCMGPDSDTLYLLSINSTDDAAEVYKFDLKTKAATEIPLSEKIIAPRYIAFYKDELYIGDYINKRVAKFPASGGQVTEAFLNVDVYSFDFDSEGNFFFINYDKDADGISRSRLRWFPASSPNKHEFIHDAGSRPFFIDKNRTPNEVYFTDYNLMKLTVQNGKVVIPSDPVCSEKLLFKSPWPTFPIFEDRYVFSSIAVNEEGEIWFIDTSNFNSMEHMYVLEPVSDATVAFLWVLTIVITILLLACPFISITSVMFVLDVVLIIVDKIRSPSSKEVKPLDSVNLIHGGQESSNPSVSDANSKKSLPSRYVSFSIIRNTFYIIASVLYGIAALILIYITARAAWSHRGCIGSMCGLGQLIVDLVGVSALLCSVSWFLLYWSPLYFASSFVRKNPFKTDIVVCIVNLSLFALTPLVLAVTLVISSVSAAISMIFVAPIVAFCVPAIVLDIMFLSMLFGLVSEKKQQQQQQPVQMVQNDIVY